MSIVEEIRQNREKGAQRLQSEYKAGLLALARRFCADESDAEELVNRTFAEVVANIDGYLEQSAFFGWMSRILINIRNKEVRRKENVMVSCVANLPGDAPDEEACNRVFNGVDSEIVRDIIERLPDDMKSAIVMHYFMDMPVKEIARVLLVPAGTIKWRLHCARQALTAKLGTAAKSSTIKKLLTIGIFAIVLTLVGFAAAMVVKAAAADVECGVGEPVVTVTEDASVGSFPTAGNQLETNPQEEGEPGMNIKQKKALALAAATLVTAPLAAASCIVSGSTDRSAQVVTTKESNSGLNTFAAPEVRLDGLNLRSDEFVGMKVIIR